MRGEFGNALVLEVVGERTKGDIERDACLRGEMPMMERRGVVASPVIIGPLAVLGFLDQGETHERQEI